MTDETTASKKLYIGNLPWSVKNDDLLELFSEFGEITDHVVITERGTDRSKGFGFVTFANPENADKAIEEMNEKDIDGRPLTVNEAKPMEKREPRSGGYNDRY